MTHRDAARSLTISRSLLLASLACACSLTHDRDRQGEPAAGTAAAPATHAGGAGAGGAQAGMQAQPVPTAGSSGSGGSAGADMQPPQDDPWSEPFPLPPLAPEVEERFKALQEPDFAQAPDALAAMRCGSIFRIDEVTEVGDPPLADAHAEVTRVFDARNRLLVAEESATVTGSAHLIVELEGGDSATRLQLDYDAEGRPQRVRQGALDEHRNEHGTVVDFTYGADGSFQAVVATTHVYPDVENLIARPPRGFCEHMEFDAAGRLGRTSWGCGKREEARAFSYDAQGRPLEVTGRPLASLMSLALADPRFRESSEWSIRYDYATAGEVSVVWNELDLRGETPLEIEQRLVRRFDPTGRLVSTALDYGNDGTLDERADYTYDDPQSQAWSRQAYDFGLDGVIDLVEERSRQGDTQVIERRHMAQWGDEQRFHYSIGHFYGLLTSGRHSSSPQSASRWSLQLDADDRVVAAQLDMRLVPQPPTTNGGPQKFASSLVQRFAGGGYVEHVAVAFSGMAYVTLGAPPETVPSRRETTCSLEPACEGRTPVLPDDPALAACQTDSGAASRLLLPHMQSPYLPPPFDRIEAMRTRHAHAASFDPRPPTVREIVGY